jgi:hypothetical protein
MRIQSVRIETCRTLKTGMTPSDCVTSFIGPDGALKSPVLRALDWFFHAKPGSLTDIRLAKNQPAYRSATLRAERRVPEIPRQNLAKAQGQ